MTDPQETSQNVETAAHSAGEPDLNAPEKDTGSDVGGPGAAMESTVEEGLSGSAPSAPKTTRTIKPRTPEPIKTDRPQSNAIATRRSATKPS